MKITSKLTILFLILGITLSYSLYHKKKLDRYFEESSSSVLKMLPKELGLKDFYSKEEINLTKIAKGSAGLLVHFWGTWCAPCEYELPSFIKFAAKLKSKNIKVILLAVNDDDKKIIKFMKRFKALPENVIVVHNKDGSVMRKFGVVKVPETFLFDKNSRTLSGFSGPQDWTKSFYFQSVDSLIK